MKKRVGKKAAIILAAAFALTSVPLPVYAEEGDTSGTETSSQELLTETVSSESSSGYSSESSASEISAVDTGAENSASTASVSSSAGSSIATDSENASESASEGVSGSSAESTSESASESTSEEASEDASSAASKPAASDTSATEATEEFSISYDGNADGVDAVPEKQTVAKSATDEKTETDISSLVPTRDGYTFLAWNTQKDGSGEEYKPSASVSLTEDITLYAQWEENRQEAVLSGNCGDGLTWSYDPDANTLTISGTGDMYDFAPEQAAESDTNESTASDPSVPWSAFRTEIETITLPDEITSIGRYAFEGCSSIASVSLEEGVRSIGDHAFEGCERLSKIRIPASVSEIGSNAFAESGSSDTPLEGLTICGYTGSEAEEYANDKGIPFQSLGVYISRDRSSLPYTDLNENAWYMPSVRKVVEKGLMTGTTPTTFGPDKSITRAMFAAILYRLEGRPDVSYSEIFSDVPDGKYYSLAVTWASKNGIIAGTGSGKFSPDSNITRAQMAAIMYRYATYKESDIGEYAPIYNYPDMTDVRPFVKRPLRWAVYFKVLTGKKQSGTYYLCPNNDATRAECAAIIVRYTENIQVSGTTINVTDSPYNAVANDDKDDTDAIRRAINSLNISSGQDTVYIPSGTFNISLSDNGGKTGIFLRTGARLIMNSSTILKVSGSSKDDYQVLRVSGGIDNVIISGGTLIGERYIHEGTSGEGGMGVNIYDSTNVTIADMTITKNWGDGIFVGSVSDGDTMYGCDGITIDNCKLEDNRRSNISIVDGDNVTINDCTMTCMINTSESVAPRCNINIEPNDTGEEDLSLRTVPSDQVCNNITIQYTTIYGDVGHTDGQFFCFRSQHNPDNVDYITSKNLQVRHCSIHGDSGTYSTLNSTISDTNFYNKGGKLIYRPGQTEITHCNFNDGYGQEEAAWR
ncbi:MAG: S-layer homology domain-containing protein [Lachnospiraceae bacterium]|jgi:uncharacterized repeat protein (TIGR02543 family)|nr:S-layer homology domain-containing protein [Lachnospiraceae bacterium]